MQYRFYAQRVFSFKWAESVLFYKEKIGFPIKFEDNKMGWAEFDLDGGSLAIERVDKDKPDAKSLVGRFVGTSIFVEDIELVYQTLSDRGVRFTSPPKKQSWGGVLAHFEDPDQNIITLVGESND